MAPPNKANEIKVDSGIRHFTLIDLDLSTKNAINAATLTEIR